MSKKELTIEEKIKQASAIPMPEKIYNNQIEITEDMLVPLMNDGYRTLQEFHDEK